MTFELGYIWLMDFELSLFPLVFYFICLLGIRFFEGNLHFVVSGVVFIVGLEEVFFFILSYILCF